MTEPIFYCPGYIELLFDFFSKFQIKTNEPYIHSKKKEVLFAIDKLLKQQILIAGEFKENAIFEKWNLEIPDIISKINYLWDEKLEFPEFYNLVWFKYEDCYIQALGKKGFKSAPDWDVFINENFDDFEDFEKWINENQPTGHLYNKT